MWSTSRWGQLSQAARPCRANESVFRIQPHSFLRPLLPVVPYFVPYVVPGPWAACVSVSSCLCVTFPTVLLMSLAWGVLVPRRFVGVHLVVSLLVPVLLCTG